MNLYTPAHPLFRAPHPVFETDTAPFNRPLWWARTRRDREERMFLFGSVPDLLQRFRGRSGPQRLRMERPDTLPALKTGGAPEGSTTLFHPARAAKE